MSKNKQASAPAPEPDTNVPHIQEPKIQAGEKEHVALDINNPEHGNLTDTERQKL